MSWLEQKYISLLSHRLRNFRAKGSQLYNASCPTCGDSSKNEYKARLYIYMRKGDFWVHCHNCGLALPFTRWLKDFDKGLYETYLVEKLGAPLHKPKQADQPDESFVVNMDKAARNAPLEGLLRLSDMDPDDWGMDVFKARALLAYDYIKRREIPAKWLTQLYYIENFKEWTNRQIPDKFKHPEIDEPRLLIPLFDQEGGMIGFQCRILGEADARLRYMTCVVNHQYPKLWGLDKVDFSKDYYVTEGPLDAMFLENALATCGGKISSEILKLRDGSSILEKSIVVYDNEPRNVDVVKNLWKAIRGGFRVVIWPTNISEKDINDMAKARYAVWSIMHERTFANLRAEQEFRLWNRSVWKP